MAEYESPSLSIADIQATVTDYCSPGDTVVLPAGEYYDFGNGTVDFPNNVSLRGQGVASTIIHRDSVWESPMFRWNDSYTDSTHTVEIKDFTLYGNDEVTMWGINIRRSVVDFKIHDLNIYECGYCGIGIEGSLSQGVIYNCNFIDCYLSGHGYGVRIDADDIGGEDHYGDNSWGRDLDWNDDYWVFIEDCYFDHCRHATSACWGARYVLRHCEIINGIRDTCVDGHGYTDGSYRSTRAMQVYENIIWHNDTYEPDGIVAHGGDCLGWNNQFVGDWDSGATIYITVNNCDTSYPHVDQSMDSHYWGNSRNGVPFTELDSFFENECPYLLQEERNYWLEAPDGYVPYTYPHPLRDEEGVLVSASAGAFHLAGPDITLTKTGAMVMDVDKGSYIFGGSDATLTKGYVGGSLVRLIRTELR